MEIQVKKVFLTPSEHRGVAEVERGVRTISRPVLTARGISKQLSITFCFEGKNIPVDEVICQNENTQVQKKMSI